MEKAEKLLSCYHDVMTRMPTAATFFMQGVNMMRGPCVHAVLYVPAYGYSNIDDTTTDVIADILCAIQRARFKSGAGDRIVSIVVPDSGPDRDLV